MAYDFIASLALGPGKTGLTVTAALYDTTMTPVVGLASTITEAPGLKGNYLAVHSVPGTTVGGIQYLDGVDELGFIAVEPPVADAVWDELLAGHAGAGSAGVALSAAGVAADPWLGVVPGVYAPGTAGYAIGNNLNATVSSRLATAGYTAPPSAATVAAAVWDALLTGIVTVGSIGKKLKDWSLGSDYRVLVSADGHSSGVAAASVTGAVGSVTGNVGGNVGGNVAGSVGSVTGAVGSVTGNVGGNVVGSVGSVTAPVTAGTVSDKTGYSLAAGQHTQISADVQAGMDTQGYSVARSVKLDNLDATVTSRSTYAGGAVASVTGNVGGNVNGNVAGSVGSVTAPVTAGTVSDKTGYALTAGEHTAVQADADAALTAKGYSAARSLKLDNLDATVSSRLATSGYTAPANANIASILANTDVATSTRSSHSAADVWAVGTRTLTSAVDLSSAALAAIWDRLLTAITTAGSIGKLIKDNLNAAVGSIVAAPTVEQINTKLVNEHGDGAWGGDITLGEEMATAVWAAPSRTLTQASTSAAPSQTSGALVARRGDSYSGDITGLGNITGRSKLWVTVKHHPDDADTEAVLQWIEGTGLTRVNGAVATATDGTITVTNQTSGNVRLTLKPSVVALLPTGILDPYDVQVLIGTDISSPGAGTFTTLTDITRAVS